MKRLQVLAEKVAPMHLTVLQRLALVEWGLEDRSAALVRPMNERSRVQPHEIVQHEP